MCHLDRAQPHGAAWWLCSVQRACWPPQPGQVGALPGLFPGSSRALPGPQYREGPSACGEGPRDGDCSGGSAAVLLAGRAQGKAGGGRCTSRRSLRLPARRHGGCVRAAAAFLRLLSSCGGSPCWVALRGTVPAARPETQPSLRCHAQQLQRRGCAQNQFRCWGQSRRPAWTETSRGLWVFWAVVLRRTFC